MRNLLVTYEWNRKLFTSQIRLWELSYVGCIKVEIKERQYGSDFWYYTNEGELIASYYKDDTFGHGSQATGIELKNAIPEITTLPACAEFTRYGSIIKKAA
jgi:hypothetical protein